MDDDEAIAAVLAGDRERFAALVERYQRSVFAIVRSHSARGWGADGEVEDVAQDVFLSAYRALPRYDAARGRFSGWLYAIARNRCRDLLRRRRPAGEPAEAVAPVADRPGAESRLDEALDALPAERRTAFLLVEVHGLTQAEAAEIEDVAVGTIKSRLSRARAALREALQPEKEIEG